MGFIRDQLRKLVSWKIMTFGKAGSMLIDIEHEIRITFYVRDNAMPRARESARICEIENLPTYGRVMARNYTF